jgi:LemA protein
MRLVLALWIAVGVVAAVFVYGIYAFNRLVRIRNRVDNAWSQIDVQLRRRYDLIPNLVEAVKGYAAHEREVFEEVTRARSLGMEAGTVQDQALAENQITRGLRQLLAVAENYPQLRASENFLGLQEELTATESKIAYARQFYNDQVMDLNTRIQSFPSSVVAGLFRFQARSFFEIEEPVARPVTVDL